jgi:hypothetical protein
VLKKQQMSSSQQSHQLDLLSVTPQEKTPSTSESEQVDDTCTASSNNRSRGNSTANNEDNRLLSIPISNSKIYISLGIFNDFFLSS